MAGLRPLDGKQRDFAEKHAGEALAIARRWERRFPRFQGEFESEAARALVSAAALHDDALGMEAGHYVRWRVARACLSVLIGRRFRPTIESRFPDRIAREEDPSSSSEADEEFERAIRPCRESERQLLRLIYRDGLNQKEAGAALGLGKQQAWRLHTAAIECLRSQYA